MGNEKHVAASDSLQKQMFLNWLCTPKPEREPDEQNMDQVAIKIGVVRRTLTNWKVDPDFLREWELLYLKTIGSPESKGEIMATLLKTATDGDDPKHVQAAKTYFEIEGSMKPVKSQVEVTRNPVDLTDDELDDILSRKIGRAS